MQGRVQRAMFHLQHVVGAALDGMGDGLAMGGTEQEGLKDQHVQGSLNHFGLEGRGASRHTVMSMID